MQLYLFEGNMKSVLNLLGYLKTKGRLNTSVVHHMTYEDGTFCSVERSKRMSRIRLSTRKMAVGERGEARVRGKGLESGLTSV